MATVSMMVLMTLVAIAMLSLSTIEQRSSGGGANEADRMARANARMALMMALGELQKAAGPDQRVSATASILGSTTNPYATGTTAADGRKHWVGVWDTSSYSPAVPDTKTFLRWLVSGDQDQLDTLADAGTAAAADDVAIFEGVDAAGNADPASTVKVPKVEVATATPGNSSYYAYWVEDQGVKVDLAWNEGNFSDTDRQQAARLSTAPGPDHAVFEGPFSSGVSYPLEKGSGYVDDLEKAFSSADMPLVMGSTDNHSDWLKANRHNMAMNVRGVIADVKKGGLRRDLSLAFEMDGTAESENAAIFNQQTTEFVGNGDQQSSPYNMPGMTLKARHLFRDYGPNSTLGAAGAGQFFSDDITQPATVVRGPSWWLLRDYANLYKRLKSSGSNHALIARAYYPNRTTFTGNDSSGIPTYAVDLVDMHAQKNQGIDLSQQYVVATNMETNILPQTDPNWKYAYRPVRANYAPVLLGVNAVYSLIYTGNQLKMTVDPFFIIWNPYSTQITADRFAVTLENGFAGGVRFRHTDATGTQRLYGQPSGWGAGRGSDTTFTDFAQNKSGVNGNVTYLIDDLTMEAGEVMIYSPPKEADRSGDANVLNDELLPGLNYDANTSGIFFNEFPEYNASRQPLGWKTVNVDSNQSGSHKIDVLFNIASQSNYAIRNIIETNLPPTGRKPNELTTEANFGDSVAGQEFRLNLGGGQNSTNINKGIQWYKRGDGTEVWPFSFTFSELSAVKTSFGILSMLTLPTDYSEADTNMEVFSQLNTTPTVRVQSERFSLAPLNIYVNSVSANGINNLMNLVGIDIDAFGSGDNGFYGKSYGLAQWRHLIPSDRYSQGAVTFAWFSSLELTLAPGFLSPPMLLATLGNLPTSRRIRSIITQTNHFLERAELTMNDVSWQANDALFDRYYLSGIAPEFTIGAGGYGLAPLRNKDETVINNAPSTGESIKHALSFFYGTDPAVYGSDYSAAKTSPVIEPYIPQGKTPVDVVDELMDVDIKEMSLSTMATKRWEPTASSKAPSM